jgi:hypothetical protein
MTTKILLRIASLLMLTHLIGHSFGQNGWKKSGDPVMREVAHWMTGPRFPFMGVSRSMGDYFDGYGYIASVSLAMFAVLLWLVSSKVSTAGRVLQSEILVVGIALLCLSGIEFLYFFPFAAIISLLAAVLTFVGWGMIKMPAGHPATLSR